MPKFLSTSTAIAICDRCRFKMPYHDLRPDGNSPGLCVCEKCYDQKDPYRLPARKTENFNLRFARPEVNPVTPIPVGIGFNDEGFVIGDQEDEYFLQVGEEE